MADKKTAEIQRYHCYGTPRHHLRVMYQGRTLRWSEGVNSVYADWTDMHQDADIEHARSIAKKFGFTHVRFTGNWDRRTKPLGGKV